MDDLSSLKMWPPRNGHDKERDENPSDALPPLSAAQTERARLDPDSGRRGGVGRSG